MLDWKTFGVQMVQHTKLSVKFTSHLIINCLVMLLFQQKWAHGLPMFISESTLKGEYKCPPYREVHHMGSKNFFSGAHNVHHMLCIYQQKRGVSSSSRVLMHNHGFSRFRTILKKKRGRRSCTPNGAKIRELFL